MSEEKNLSGNAWMEFLDAFARFIVEENLLTEFEGASGEEAQEKEKDSASGDIFQVQL